MTHHGELEDSLVMRCMAEEDTLAELRCALRNALLRAGLADIEVPAQLQNCRLIAEPGGGMSLAGEWRKQRGKVVGSVVIAEHGELFAELLVRRPAPEQPDMRVDRIVAVGTAGALRTELRLVPARRDNSSAAHAR